MLFIISALGIVCGFVVGLDGLMLGGAGELERIAAIACFALAAAGLVGLLADDGWRTRRTRRRVERGAVHHAIAVAPIMALSVGVFVATLIPAIYVSLPFLAVWWYASHQRWPAALAPARGASEPDLAPPLQVPAYP
jgi:hypothetical protein